MQRYSFFFIYANPQNSTPHTNLTHSSSPSPVFSILYYGKISPSQVLYPIYSLAHARVTRQDFQTRHQSAFLYCNIEKTLKPDEPDFIFFERFQDYHRPPNLHTLLWKNYRLTQQRRDCTLRISLHPQILPGTPT